MKEIKDRNITFATKSCPPVRRSARKYHTIIRNNGPTEEVATISNEVCLVEPSKLYLRQQPLELRDNIFIVYFFPSFPAVT